MKKLTDTKIQWIIRELEAGMHPGYIASFVRVTKRRINQLKKQYKQYKAEDIINQLKVPVRKKKSVSPECERIILNTYQTYQSGPVILKTIIKKMHGVVIPHNTIYQVMVMHQLVVENSRKKCQRKWYGLNANIQCRSDRATGKSSHSMDRKNGLLHSSTIHSG